MKAMITNVNYRGSLDERINLREMKLCFPNSKLCFHPFQLIIKDEKCTILFFTSGKFRVMGYKSDDVWDASSVVYKYTSTIDKEYFPLLELQSMTVKAKFDKPLDLHKLSTLIKSNLELELFPVLTITKYKPVTVNVFTTGAIVMCGIKNVEFCDSILNEIQPFLNVCAYY
jgi:TATA-box binding protein (TBP) (component of TFIID and TFIIIB)